ncbi:MAG: hypothetical protein ACYTHM_17175 [Planctomycetota bacterium]
MTQEEINEAEWKNPDNWTGPKGISIYFSKKDTRGFVPKQLPMTGPTMNLGKTSGFYWLFFGTLFLVGGRGSSRAGNVVSLNGM